jgi:ATP-dependent Zn protease
MIFEYGMGDEVSSRTVRADNYALSEQTKQLRDAEQARLTDEAFAEAVRLVSKHRRSLDAIAQALLEKETIDREELSQILDGVEPDSRASDAIGTPRAVSLPD